MMASVDLSGRGSGGRYGGAQQQQSGPPPTSGRYASMPSYRPPYPPSHAASGTKSNVSSVLRWALF